MGSAVPGHETSALLVGPGERLEALFPGETDRAGTPAAALEQMANKHYDVVVVNHATDRELTEHHLSYLRTAKGLHPDSRLIVLAPNTVTANAIEELRQGTFAYFSEPFDLRAVKEAILLAIQLPNRSEGIEVLSAVPDFITVRLRCSLETADRLTQFMRELPGELSEKDRRALSEAFREMLLNAIEHGGKLNPNEWVRVSRIRTGRTILYHIKDPGEGFAREDLKHAALNNPPEDPVAHVEYRNSLDMRPGGFGMLIASQLVDEVIYNQKGNEVILIKHLAH